MTPKEDDLRKMVLTIRAGVCDKARQAAAIRHDIGTAAYYEGKADGYRQAIDLLSESLESIKIELQ